MPRTATARSAPSSASAASIRVEYELWVKPTTNRRAPKKACRRSALCSGPRTPIWSRSSQSRSHAGSTAGACTTVTPERSSIAAESSALGAAGPPSPASTSAWVTPRLGPSVVPQCMTTAAPHAAAVTAAATDRCGMPDTPS